MRGEAASEAVLVSVLVDGIIRVTCIFAATDDCDANDVPIDALWVCKRVGGTPAERAEYAPCYVRLHGSDSLAEFLYRDRDAFPLTRPLSAASITAFTYAPRAPADRVDCVRVPRGAWRSTQWSRESVPADAMALLLDGAESRGRGRGPATVIIPHKHSGKK